MPEKINEDIKIAGEIIETDNDTNAKIRIEITYPGELREITIDGEMIEVPEPENGVYVIEQTKTENGTYKIVAKDTDRGYQNGEVVIDNLCWDMEIWNKADMDSFRDLVNSGKKFTGRTVQVMDNIDLERENWVPIALGKKNAELGIEYDKLFCGIFEGNKRIISNLYINSNEYLAAGLFANLDGTIQNVILENVDIYNGYEITRANLCSGTGGIVGSTWERKDAKIINCGINSGTIRQVTTKSEENTEWKDIYVGGIVGLHDGNMVSNCYNKASVYAQGPTTKYDTIHVGGIVGLMTINNGKQLINCYNTGNIRGEGSCVLAGGVVGGNVKPQNECINSYNVGEISIKPSEPSRYSYIGGVLGRKGWVDYQPGGPVTNCYCLNNIVYSYNYWTAEGMKNTTEGVLDSSALQNSASMLGSAFIADPGGKNNGYPILVWELTNKK